jgi:FAD/FMN-containing dehydrogenase
MASHGRCERHGLYERPIPARGTDGFFHPTSEAELAMLAKAARLEGAKLRVRGSAHSVAGAIYTDDGPDPPSIRRHFDVMLDRYIGVTFDDARLRVTVQAGCHLGHDPRDPTRTSTWDNSLLAQLEQRGWALPDLGGVSHQTVSGFLMTGSCGGTVMHAIEDAVVGWRIVDGTGTVHALERDGNDPRFHAIGCSLGLLGIVSTVTLQCLPRYDIVGREDITAESDTAYELFGDGEAGLEGFFRRTEYARLMWWPQAGVRRVVTWQARRMRETDYNEQSGARGALRPKAYSALGDGIRSPGLSRVANLAAQAAGGLFYDSLAETARRFEPLARASIPARVVGGRLRHKFATRLLPAILRQFTQPSSVPQRFWESWCHGLPMDNQMSDESLPTEFTEIWVPLERAGEVMRALREHYDRAGHAATGSFICEVYAARRTQAWLHPAYERDSLRIDLFWFARNHGDPTRGWFVQFWRLLQPFGYRLHWGKYLPIDPELGAVHLRRHTPRWDDFLALRQLMDPDGIFLTSYWRAALGLEP